MKNDDEMAAKLQQKPTRYKYRVINTLVIDIRTTRFVATILARVCSEGGLNDFLSWDVESVTKLSSVPLGLIYSPNGKAGEYSTLSVLRLIRNAYESKGYGCPCGRLDEFCNSRCLTMLLKSFGMCVDRSICMTTAAEFVRSQQSIHIVYPIVYPQRL